MAQVIDATATETKVEATPAARPVAIRKLKGEQALAPVSGDPIMALITRAATDPTFDIDKFERLVAMSERKEAALREQAFSAAMSEAQAEMRPVAADSSNPQTKSKYASYAALDRAMRPIYTNHGFGLSFDTEPGAPETYVRVVCHVSHSSGHQRKYQVDMPADGKGAKGGDVMTKTHAVGSGLTYGQRYLLKLIFNVAVGEDDDGNKAGDDNEFISEAQAAGLKKLIEATGGNVEKFCKFAKVETLTNIYASRYEAAVAAVNNAAAARKAKP